MQNIVYQIGQKGAKTPPPPIEEPDSLQSKATAKIVDLLCEGEIEGWANGSDSIYKSVYLNEIPVMAENGVMNFEGIQISAKKGLSNQDYLPGYDAVETEVSVSQEVTKESGGYDQIVIADGDVDDIRLTLGVQGFLEQHNNGDIRATEVSYRIQVKGDGGVYFTVVDSSITGKTSSTYQKSYMIRNLKTYGTAPWTLNVIRDTDDSTSIKLQNKIYVISYTTIKNVKLRYPDSVIVGLDIDAEKFGNSVPFRYYKILGRKIRVPNNYSPSASNLYGEDLYAGTWDGITFKWEYATNPAWVLFDLLTDTTFGLGLADSKIDVWSLYSAGIWCDGEIEYVEKVKNPLGTYDSTNKSERRFTFNGVIQDRRQALEVVNHVASVINAFPIWSGGQLSLVQDKPKNVTRIASFVNVKEGDFSYEGSPKGQRHTVARVQYADLNNFNKPGVITIQDDEGLKTYGYNPIDIVAFGCNNRNEAIRRAKLLLYTDLNNNEIVTFIGGIEWANADVGEIIEVQDPNMYVIDSYYSGRVKSGTTTSIIIDRAIALDSTKTYTLHLQTEGDAAIITTLIVPTTGNYTTLTWSGTQALENAAETDFVFSIYCTEVETARKFLIASITEVEFGIEYQIQGILYDSNKWTVSESNIAVIPDTPPRYQGEIAPPSSLDAQVFTYTEGSGSQEVRKYGVLLSYVLGDDPRILEYEVRYRLGDSYVWNFAGTTGQSSLTIRDLISGTYDFSIRAKGISGNSVWVNLNDIVVNAALDAPPPPRNLQVKGGGDIFSGRDCHIEWDSPLDSTYTDGYVPSAGVGHANLNYKIEVRKLDDTLLRTYLTASDSQLEYTYSYGFNQDDTSNVPLRTFKFQIYTMDSYGSQSAVAATLVVSNPAPSMASSRPTLTAKTGYLRSAWDAVNDNDMEYYEVYFGTSSVNPDRLVGKITHPNTILNIQDVTSDNTYYVKVIPYDAFGIGVQSQISDGNSPLQLVDIDVQTELQESIKITDSIGTDIGTLRSLYDFVHSSGGILYRVTSSGDIWIQYEYALDTYVDRCVLYLGSALKCYFAYSLDGVNFDFLKANPDHTLTDDTLLYAVNQADARTNYLSITSSGKFSAIFPNNIPAKQVRIYLTQGGSDYQTTIHEFIPNRIIISELAALGQLSAITADIGEITAGSLRSANFGPTAGMAVDLDLKTVYFGGFNNPTLFYNDLSGELTIRAAVTFQSGSTGYNQLTDKPTSLADIDSAQNSKLNGVAAGATNDSAWRVVEDGETKIDGGKLAVGSSITLNDGGYMMLGNGNIYMDTVGEDTGRIIVAKDGGYQSNDYMLLEDSDLTFFYWNGTSHEQYKSLRRIEVGSASNNVTVTLPGIWKSAPNIVVSPKNLGCYSAANSLQNQTLLLEAVNLTQYQVGRWRFTPRASLQLGSGVQNDSVPEEQRHTTSSVGPVYWYTAPAYTFPVNIPAFNSREYSLANAVSTQPQSINVDCLVQNYISAYYSYTITPGDKDNPPVIGYAYYYDAGVITLQAQIKDSNDVWYTRATQQITIPRNNALTAVPIPFGTITKQTNYIKAFRIVATWNYWQATNKHWSWTNENKTSYAIVTVRSISGFLPTQTTLAAGSLNWTAIGN